MYRAKHWNSIRRNEQIHNQSGRLKKRIQKLHSEIDQVDKMN